MRLFYWFRSFDLFGRGDLHGLELDLGADDGEEGVGASAFGESENGGDDLVYGVALDDAAAVEAGDGAAAGVEEAEVVVDLGGSGYGGAGVAGLVLLLDGDGGGETVHVVHVGLFDALQELAGVGRERLDVAALPSAYTVSKASEDLPEPLTPLTTVRALCGMSTSMPLRLWVRAPRMVMRSRFCSGFKLGV